MIHQYKVELQEIMKIKRKRITTCSRENVTKNKKKFIENNMRKKKYSNKHQIIQVMLCNAI